MYELSYCSTQQEARGSPGEGIWWCSQGCPCCTTHTGWPGSGPPPRHCPAPIGRRSRKKGAWSSWLSLCRTGGAGGGRREERCQQSGLQEALCRTWGAGYQSLQPSLTGNLSSTTSASLTSYSIGGFLKHLEIHI